MERRFVYAVKIYEENGYKPMAELAFGDGGRPTGETIIIHWDDINERNKYVINAYTFIWDTRFIPTHKTFEDFINK